MTNRSNMIPIAGRLHCVAEGEPICGSDEVLYEPEGQTAVFQSELNKRVADKLPANVTNPFNGLGRVVLPMHLVDVEENDTNVQKNVLTQTMINQANTIYVIQYDFTLGEDITVPANCVLEFDGGSISGAYTVTGNNTGINAQPRVQIFSGVDIQGTWNVTDIYVEWMNIPNTSDCGNEVRSICRLQNDNIYQNIYLPNYEIAFTPTDDYNKFVILSSNTHLHIINNIRINNNSLRNYEAVTAIAKQNITIDGGGAILGDVDSHDYSAGGTFEWGMAVSLISCKHVAISNITTTKCTGDGIYLGGDDEAEGGLYVNACENITINNVSSTYNGRQGCSIIHARGVFIRDSEFSYTGNSSAAPSGPWAGIDIEPNNTNSWNEDILIDNCVFKSNANELVFHINVLRNVTIRNCDIDYLDSSVTKTSKRQLDTSVGIAFSAGSYYNINIINCNIISIGYDSFAELTEINVRDCKLCGIICYTANSTPTNAIFKFTNCIFDETRVIGSSAFSNNVVFIRRPSTFIFDNCTFDFTDTGVGIYLWNTSANEYDMSYKNCDFIGLGIGTFKELSNCYVEGDIYIMYGYKDTVMQGCRINGGVNIYQDGAKTVRIIGNDIKGLYSGHIFNAQANRAWAVNLVIKNNSVDDSIDLTTEEAYVRSKCTSLIWKGNC